MYTPKDFLHLGNRAAVDQSLKRLTKAGTLRRIGRGLYDWPRHSDVLGRAVPAGADAVAGAIQRRARIELAADSLTAANAFGLTNAVPTRPAYVASRAMPTLTVGKRHIQFFPAGTKLSKWLGTDAAPIVQALFWAHKQKVLSDTMIDIIARKSSPAAKRSLARDILALPGWAIGPARRIVGIVPSEGDGQAGQ